MRYRLLAAVAIVVVSLDLPHLIQFCRYRKQVRVVVARTRWAVPAHFTA